MLIIKPENYWDSNLPEAPEFLEPFLEEHAYNSCSLNLNSRDVIKLDLRRFVLPLLAIIT